MNYTCFQMAQWKLQVFHPKSNGLTALQTWHRKANGPTALKTSSWIVRWRPLGILSRTGGTGRDGIPPVFMEHRGGEHRKPSCARFIQYPEMSLIERALEIDNEKHFLSYTLDENDVLGGIKGFVGYAEVILRTKSPRAFQNRNADLLGQRIC